MKNKNKIKEGGTGLRAFFWIVILFCDAVVLYPIINVVAVSLSSYGAYAKNPAMIFPHQFSVQAYLTVLRTSSIWSGYRTTIIVTVCGTFLGTMLTILTAYPLSRPNLKGKKYIMPFILFTMFFSGGMIPAYFLMRSLHLLDTLAALILPGCLSAYNVILMRNFFESIPGSLIEAAKIDGASEPKLLFSIVVPLAKPIISVISLFLAVGYWNNYFSGIIYIRSQSKWPLQLVLREIIASASSMMENTGGNMAEGGALPSIMLQYASIVVVMVPILCIYPFIQKYFEKGIMLGAVK